METFRRTLKKFLKNDLCQSVRFLTGLTFRVEDFAASRKSVLKTKLLRFEGVGDIVPDELNPV